MSDVAKSPTARPSMVRRPRGTVLLDGKMASFLSFEVEQREHFTADVWRVEFDAWKQPQGYGFNFWSDVIGVIVEARIGFLLPGQDVGAVPSSASSLILGQADNVEINPVGGLITISGRSLASRFMDNKTTNKWTDQTASQVAETLAKSEGLSINTATTSVPIGQYYDSAHAGINRSVAEWDLLTFLAQREGFDCFVSGTTLYFGPPIVDKAPLVLRVQQNAGGNIWSNTTRMRLHRSLTLSQDITVTVISHDAWTGQQVKATAFRAAKGKSHSTKVNAQTKQKYVLRRAGMTQDQAQQLATETLKNITKFERTFEAGLEGDPTVTPHTRQAKVQGTGTSFDQLYYIDKVVHMFSVEAGYSMQLHGKNTPEVSTEEEPPDDTEAPAEATPTVIPAGTQQPGQ